MFDRFANLIDGALIVFAAHVEDAEREIRFVVVGIQLDRLLHVFDRLLVFENGGVGGAAEAIRFGVFRIDGDRAREWRDGFVATAEKDQRLAVAEERSTLVGSALTAFWNWSIASSGLLVSSFNWPMAIRAENVVRIVRLKNGAEVFFSRFVILQSHLRTAAADESRDLRFQRLGSAALPTRLFSGFAGFVESGHRGGVVAGLECGFAFGQKRLRVAGFGGSAALNRCGRRSASSLAGACGRFRGSTLSGGWARQKGGRGCMTTTADKNRNERSESKTHATNL